MKGKLNQKETNIIIADLIEKIKRLSSKNTDLNKLNKLILGKTKKQLEEIQNLNFNNNKLESIVNDKDIEIKDLNKKISDSEEETIKILNLENQNSKNLKTINDGHQKLNGELRIEIKKLTEENEKFKDPLNQLR